MKNSTSLRLLKSFGCSSKFILTMTYALIFSGINIFADDIQVGETTRNAIIYAPKNLPVNSPLLISMHGMNQDANYQQNQSKWESVADTAKFALVYPNGIGNSWDISGDRDVNYILAIIDTMANRYQIDRNRVYLSGFSMGGMMTYHAANKIADKIAAFAPVSGVPMWGGTYNSSRPIPIIHVHGDADDVVTYDNRIVPYLEGWVKRNNCTATPVITNPYPANKPYCGSYKTHWGNGDEGTEVTLLTLGGKGHWHSNDPNGVMTSSEIWNFVKRYSLNPGAPIVSITSPSNNKVLEADEAITITTTITNTEGEITKVKFFDGKTLLATVEEAPYEYRWENIPAGEHTILVVAYNSEDKKGKASVNISVNAPRGPVLIGSLPETNSFDLKAESLNFTFFFNEKVNTEIAQATLKGEDSEIELIVEKNGWSETLNITLPENFTPENGKYTLTTSNTINESDVLSRDNASIFFIIGEEISNGPEIVFNPDIQYECDYENGSIPYGWKRVMGSDIAESGTKGMGGSRVMFFEDGGDFNAGFYICPRGSGSPCQIFYGTYDEIKGKNDELTDYSLSLKKNSYTVSFYTAYWNNGAADNKRKINFIITDKAGNEIFSNKNISSTKNLGESAMQIVTNSDYHEFTFELAEDTKIEMEWSVSAELGWEGMIMGGVKLIANAPLSYICKQNLSEAVGSAQNTFDSAEDNKYHGIVRDNMHSVLEKYKDFAGTTENEYKSAVEEIVAAENELKNHIASVNESEDIDAGMDKTLSEEEISYTKYFNVQGIEIANPEKGMNIKKTGYKNGKIKSEKFILE